MKRVANLILPIVFGGFCGCGGIDKGNFDNVEYMPADLRDYDEGLFAYDGNFNKSEPEYVYPFLCGVTVLYPNLVAMRIYSDDGESREIDFDWLRSIRRLSQVDISGRWGVRNFVEFCNNRSKENITVRLSYGDWYSLDGEICKMPRIGGGVNELACEDAGPDVMELLGGRGDVVPDLRIGDYIGGDSEKCRLSVEMLYDLYKEGDSFRFADFNNDGDNVVAIRNFPESCNAVSLFGNFKLAESCNGEFVESMVVSGRGEMVGELLNEITPVRFPRLRYLRVYADADHEIEVSVTGLLNFPGLKLLTFKSKNVIPNGLTRLECLGEKTFLEIRVAVRRSR